MLMVNSSLEEFIELDDVRAALKLIPRATMEAQRL
jgi:hypothetical protein